MKLGSAAYLKRIDTITIEKLGVPSTLLMTRAARALAQETMSVMGSEKVVCIFCGSGNNGGDGVAAGIYMKSRGYTVRAILVGSRSKMTEDTLEMEVRLKDIGGQLEDFPENVQELGEYLDSCGAVIDAMFGIGLNSPLRGNALIAAQLMNEGRCPVIAADVPSGVNPDTGEIYPGAVKADVTVTFSMAKVCHYSVPGCICCGRTVIADIGVPGELTDNPDADTFAVTEQDVRLLPRDRDTHKGDYGSVMIVAGSLGYTGAPQLASLGAVCMGSGLVFLGVPDRIYDIQAVKCLEAMPFPLECDIDGKIIQKASVPVLKKLEKCDVCLIGPGLGRSNEVREFVESVIKKSELPVVVDADGINALAENINVLSQGTCPLILTPHDGEFKRLGADFSKGSRVEIARAFAAEYGCVLVLKGHRTVCAFPDGQVYINTTGNPGMAKGGSGDVLSGMIASLIGQLGDIKTAVISAVYIHGLAGDMCADKYGEYSMTPGDMIDMLPQATKKLTR